MIVLAAMAYALELWISGCSRIELVLPAMIMLHTLIGIGEDLIIAFAVALICRIRRIF